jgi:large subunit ribosomal protein L20
MATEAVDRAQAMAFVHRKQKKRNFRRLWTVRINAACKANGMTYSRFIEGLIKANITLNRKMLSEIAIYDEAGFIKLVQSAKAALV